MTAIKWKNPLCLLGLHKYELGRVYVGRNEWLKQIKCTRCGHIKQEDSITWLSTKKQLLYGAPRSSSEEQMDLPLPS